MTISSLTPEERAELETLCAWLSTQKSDVFKNPFTILRTGLDHPPKHDELREAAQQVIKAESDWRESAGQLVLDDPLSDALKRLQAALDNLCPTKPAPAPHPAQSAEVERAPAAEAGRVDFMLVLQAHAERLNHLLKDPHPGLSTWAKFFGQEVQWFSDYWAGKFAQP